MTTPLTTQVGLRFVQLRRQGDTDPGACTAGPKLLDAVVDFRHAWSDPVREALTGGDRERVRQLLADRLAARDDRLDEFAGQTLILLRRTALDARLSVGQLRDGIAGWATEHDVSAAALAAAVAELTGWVVDVLVLGRFLRLPRSPAVGVLIRLLRGVALLRLARSDAEATCLVRALLGGRDLLLPDPPAPVPDDPDADRAARFADLGQTVRRLRSRVSAVGRPDATVQDLRDNGFPDLGPAIAATAQAAADLGVPTSTTLASLARVFSAEEGDARRRATANLTPGRFDPIPDGGGVDPLPYPAQPLVPVLDAYARIAGRGDLMIIRTALLRYQPGEISYIENVLASEARGRTHVSDTSTSETVTTTSKTIDASSQELASTEQNSLDRALQTAASQQNSSSLGVSVSGGLGPVQAGIDVNADQSTSTETSNSSAVSYAKTLTESASQLLRTETGERRTTTSTVRVTETNTHSFDNSAGTANISGIYRWLDKVDQAQVYNYGERLMLEFIVPEPAATLVWLAGQTSQDASQGAVPKPPAWFLDVNDLDDDNYADKAARWDIFGVEPPPEPETFATATFLDPAARPFDYAKNSAEKAQPEWGYTSYIGEVAVPAGYAASEAYVTVTWSLVDGEYTTDAGTPPQAVQVAIGERRITVNDSTEGVQTVTFDQPVPGPLPIGVSSDQRGGLTVVVRVRCTRTDGAREAWRLRAWETIRAGYLAQRSAYDNDQARRLARAAYQADGSAASHRQLEMLELKRSCQTLLTGQEFDLYGALDTPEGQAPRIDRVRIVAAADQIQFFEDVFEWENLTYLCYPYQWAGRDRWVTVRSRTSSDPLHQAFLQAGAARVIVPVRVGYEYAVGRYLATSQVPTLSPRPWRDGGNPYPPIEELIADALDRPGDEVAVGDPWEVVTPTSLVQLQAGPDLNPPSV